MSILIKNGILIDMVNKEYDISGTDIYIEGNVIKHVGAGFHARPPEKIIDASNKVVMPGFINCHNHSAMSIFRGYADDLELMEWLTTKIWPIEDKMKDEDVYNASMLSIVEMIKSGTTSFADMYGGSENTIKACIKSKIRSVIGCCVLDLVNVDERMEIAENLYKKYNSDMIQVVIAPHAPYTCSKETLQKCIEFAKRTNTHLNIHLAETLDEEKQILDKYNLRPTEYLKQCGIFDVPVNLAHCVHLNDSDIEIIRNIKGGISHNPISNLKLASGIAPVLKYIENGITVGLGTDGQASTNTLDMFAEMRACNYMQKVTSLKANVLDAYDTLKMATVNGSKVLGLEDRIGTIEEGKCADIIIVDINKPHLQPLNDIYSSLVYSANGADVNTTIINGKIVMENRKLVDIDEETIIAKCNGSIKKLRI